MEFASVFFIWVFLPVSLGLYYSTCCINKPKRRIFIQNIILVFFSLIFYSWGGYKALFLFCLLILLNYMAAILIEMTDAEDKKGLKCIIFTASIICNILVLCFFKYVNMMVTVVDILSHRWESAVDFFRALARMQGSARITVKQISMPLALSFIVFQVVSYLTDVYQRKIAAEKSIVNFALYLSFFPQMVQGPIMRYAELGSQIKQRVLSFTDFENGIKRFCYGIGKKVLIADVVASAVNNIWSADVFMLSTTRAWLGVLLYTIQIYYDFSGYTDMAIGIGKMFGFRICENFDYPYTALSVQEFWRKWHISLSSWFRDYIYFPLGGSRKGSCRTLFNLVIVFIVTGIWHGANLNFIAWGLYYGIVSIIERLFLGKALKKNPVKPLNWIYTIFIVMMGWVLFRSPNLYYAYRYIIVLFSAIPEAPGVSVASLFSLSMLTAFAAGILFSGIIQKICQPFYSRYKTAVPFILADKLFQAGILIMSFLMIAGGSYQPSIYGAF